MRPEARINTHCLLYSTLEEMLIPQMPFGNRPPLNLSRGDVVLLDEPKKHKHIKIYKVTAHQIEGYLFANFLDVLGPKVIEKEGARLFQKNDQGQTVETEIVLPRETPLWLMGGPSEEFCHIRYWHEDQLLSGYLKTPQIGLDK